MLYLRRTNVCFIAYRSLIV